MGVIILALFISYVFFWKRFKKKSLPMFLITFYLISSIVGGFIYYTNAVERDSSFTIESIFYFILMMLLFLVPWRSFPKNYNITFHTKNTERKILYITYFLVVINIISILLSINKVYENLSSGNVGELRSQISLIIEDSELGILHMIKSYISSTYFILISLFFYFMNKDISKTKLTIILFSSTSIIFYYLETVGRSGIVYWILMFVSNYFLFNGSATKSFLKKKVRIYLFVFLGCVSFPFFIISISRFGANGATVYTSNSFIAVLDYLSQSFVNFNTFYNLNKDTFFFGGFNFPLFAGILERIGFFNFDLKEIRMEIARTYPEHYFVFNTFIADLIIDFGRHLTVIFGIIYSLTVKRLLIRNVDLSLSRILILMFMIQLPLLGIFSSTWKMPQSNFLIIVLIILHFYLKDNKVIQSTHISAI